MLLVNNVYEPLTINLNSIALPVTKPRMFDKDINHLEIYTKDFQDDFALLQEIKRYSTDVPIFLYTDRMLPLDVIHSITFSPFSCVVIDFNSVGMDNTASMLYTVTACAITATIEVNVTTLEELRDALLCLQRTTRINRYPWNIRINKKLSWYSEQIERISKFIKTNVVVTQEDV